MYEFPIEFPAKDPDGVCVYELELDAFNASIAPNTITALVWSITPIAGDPTPPAIVAQSLAGDLTLTQVEISGGSLHSRYRVRADISLADGQHEVGSFALTIEYT